MKPCWRVFNLTGFWVNLLILPLKGGSKDVVMLQWIQLKHLLLQLLMKKQRHWLKKLSLLRLLHMLKVVTVVMVKK